MSCQVRRPAMLVIMDGCGLAPAGPDNSVSLAKRPYWDSLMARYPSTTLGASGEDVGLPDGQMGNSEVGHLNIGAGRIIYQSLSLINNAIKDGSIKENPALVGAMDAVIAQGSTLHIMGLISNGGVHSDMAHAEALIAMASERGVQRIRIDAFTDGRDVDPQSGAGFMVDFQAYIDKIAAQYGNDIAIATVSGRYYGMDRDNRWEREELAYNAIVMGEGVTATTAEGGLKAYYEKDPRGDEFVEPFVLDTTGLADGDAVIFFNFRPDRAREITRAITDSNFTGFDRKKVPHLAGFVTMTEYDPTLDVQVAYAKTIPAHVLADVLAEKGLKQFHTAETEKYAHVTFFFNGGVEKQYENEDRILVKSPKVATYDLQPEMSAYEVCDKCCDAIKSGKYDMIILNFANCDMVGHTGIFPAACSAVEAVDTCAGKVVDAIKEMDGVALITADHGNADKMYEEDGSPFTAHTTNPVPFCVVNYPCTLREGGKLADIAPTMLKILGLPQPEEMTGTSIIE